jgi:hypothetical protein
VKNELAGLTPARTCCQLSELLGIFYSSKGRLIRSGEIRTAYFPLLPNSPARKVMRLARVLGGIDPKHQTARSTKGVMFSVELVLPHGMESHFEQSAARAWPKSSCDRRAMLRGLFMGCGSVNASSARPHLEFELPTLGWATTVSELLPGHEIRIAPDGRTSHPELHVKDEEGVVLALTLMGASRALLEFKNVRAVRAASVAGKGRGGAGPGRGPSEPLHQPPDVVRARPLVDHLVDRRSRDGQAPAAL